MLRSCSLPAGSIIGKRCWAEHRPQAERVRVRKLASFYFKPVIPVASSHALGDITAKGQSAGLPLPHDVPVLVQHQPGVLEELCRAVPEVYSPPPRGCDGATMQPHEQRVLEYLDVVNRRIEQSLERGADLRWQRDRLAD